MTDGTAGLCGAALPSRGPERSMVVSGLRGVGKTVLLNALRGQAVKRAWGTGKIEARPEQSVRLPIAQAVHAAILAMEGAEIHLAQESKLVVTVEGPHEGFIADRMTAMHLLDGVLSAVLVFHQVEPAEHEAAPATV